MRWPWQREKRSTAQGYTASLTAAFEGSAVAGAEIAPLATAALEAGAGLYSRCMAAAVVKADPAIERALTPSTLALIARNLIRRGEDHHLIYVRRGRIVLEPVGFAHAHGNGPDPMSWWYSATLYGPTDSRHETVPAASMLHTRYSVDASRPWLGVPPWAWASSTGAAIAAIERMIANEAAAPHGHLLAVPEAPQPGEDEDTKILDAFRSDLAKAKGGTLVMERPANWEVDGPGASSQVRLESATYGLDRNLLDPLRTQTGRDVLSACGVPPTLFVANSDGTSQRESLRRFLHSSLVPMARIMETELRLKLDAPDLELDLTGLHAADITGRARAFGSLIKAGVAPQDAARNTGIVLDQDVTTTTPEA